MNYHICTLGRTWTHSRGQLWHLEQFSNNFGKAGAARRNTWLLGIFYCSEGRCPCRKTPWGSPWRESRPRWRWDWASSTWVTCGRSRPLWKLCFPAKFDICFYLHAITSQPVRCLISAILVPTKWKVSDVAELTGSPEASWHDSMPYITVRGQVYKKVK